MTEDATLHQEAGNQPQNAQTEPAALEEPRALVGCLEVMSIA